MKLAEQWSELLAGLPRDWQTARLALTPADDADAERTAAVLGPAAPARSGGAFRIDVARSARVGTTSPELLRRVLIRLDGEGIRGRLEAAETAGTSVGEGEASGPGPLAVQWQALVDALPDDWSHLLAQVDIDSSDFLDRAALLIVPANPTLVRGQRSLRFRCARRVGYGVAVEMARRCFERLDADRITGGVSLVHVVSESRPVATQGPVFRIGGRSV